jgi:hypothetical protein
MKQTVTSFIDFFYPPFKKWMPLVTFRYAACGGGNTLMALAIYSIGYHHVFNKSNFNLGLITFKPHIAALFLASTFSFSIGFFLNKYVVFVESNLRGRVQLFRYFLSFAFNLCLNFIMLKLLVEVFFWGAIVSQFITTALVIAVSYVTQKYFTFKSI